MASSTAAKVMIKFLSKKFFITIFQTFFMFYNHFLYKFYNRFYIKNTKEAVEQPLLYYN